jgi:hypothetical protein
VAVRYIDGDGGTYVTITSEGTGPLFDRVTGRVIYALSAQTDYLLVDRHGRRITG